MAIKQPKNKSHFILPDLGEGVHEAELIKWRVTPGDVVEEHQVLAEMETDKALVEVPSPWAGRVTKLNGNEGDILLVGSVLVEFAGDGDGDGNGAVPAAAVEPKVEGGAEKAQDEDAGTVVGSVDSGLKVPAAFTRRREAEAPAPTRGKALATPAVRRLARERGLDIDRVPGTGRGGRVTASDIDAFAGGRTAAPAAPAGSAGMTTTRQNKTLATPARPVDADGVSERIPFRGVRRKIAEALSHSVRTAVHFTVVDEADVTALEAKRHEYGRVLGRKVSMLPFVMGAVCQALREHPAMNAIVDDENAEILRKGVINLGCAVDTDHGLMVPVIKDADGMSLLQLADEVTSLARACRDRSIERERLSGGTFTLSNVGSYGGMFATPIINYPEVGILAVGRAKEQVLTRDGVFYAGLVLPLSLSCDHRVVDGAEGARFLNTVVKLLEDVDSLIGT